MQSSRTQTQRIILLKAFKFSQPVKKFLVLCEPEILPTRPQKPATGPVPTVLTM